VYKHCVGMEQEKRQYWDQDNGERSYTNTCTREGGEMRWVPLTK